MLGVRKRMLMGAAVLALAVACGTTEGGAYGPGLGGIQAEDVTMPDRRNHILSRKALHDLVWTDPVETVAKRYNLSGNGLAKVCRKHGIPLPPRGYWAKVQHGQKPRRVALRKGAGDEVVRITEGNGRRPAPTAKPDLEPTIAAAVERALQAGQTAEQMKGENILGDWSARYSTDLNTDLFIDTLYNSLSIASARS